MERLESCDRATIVFRTELHLKAAEMHSGYKALIQMYSPPSGTPLRFVVIGISVQQFLELAAKLPLTSSNQQDPEVNEVIRDGITKEEAEQIASHLGLPADKRLKFEICPGIPPLAHDAEEKPSFESNGKKFWILPEQRGTHWTRRKAQTQRWKQP